MKIIEDAVLAKMNLKRLKSHRTSVLASINKEFFDYTKDDDQIRFPVNHDTKEYADAIAYRNKVNKYYDAARSAVKVK
ncbi:hypothetical protein pEaSNUABM50_00427 [Erwinia phage pEa_SNUABM_50]|uniref:Uncharacterized protein n=4 Tax=Eneladusvirus BF TaxID=2560751 RepID=A0A7L8ZN64_9CAUD|nr:hypothetical protein FDH34_gp497 [Serratia phage BF]QOI71362.1 hypothetical protein pEaSNUABM12_00433 [Erwinia phage pEa_SNUABM_12]QOI71904.1 hypothetical protein pEaSNUABM47_00429 [Erwinia phage pEa_SNUABM_47]QOI72443.1 hypothetical protein pEaSNUABM50_00427 [Erwinia phage pEa_SNUABM_50]QXO11570.1 hypothetical protein pEaSNUABM19_00433 [Erwinia phage pEa_SNUABM_19]QXO12118.1 hypothetical protein pEaSNUABM44_00431 [Erwinia phage pEa_SNUABM_44]QXO12671.1 hypothetical protein pEaSNUABM49_004